MSTAGPCCGAWPGKDSSAMVSPVGNEHGPRYGTPPGWLCSFDGEHEGKREHRGLTSPASPDDPEIMNVTFPADHRCSFPPIPNTIILGSQRSANPFRFNVKSPDLSPFCGTSCWGEKKMVVFLTRLLPWDLPCCFPVFWACPFRPWQLKPCPPPHPLLSLTPQDPLCGP